ncbi:hypothetical protein N7470_004704 [Penicillium chermesinum]|nr:hypothetical protein N7470_004704 [Penicillium chermesinum]
MNSSIPPWRSTASAPAPMATAFPPSGTLMIRRIPSPSHAHRRPAATAYSPVQARSLAHPVSASQPANGFHQTPGPEPRSKVEFPPAVRSYVQRCLDPSNQIASVEMSELQTKLKLIITEAAENQSLHRIDWDRMQLPQVIIQNERNKVLSNPSVLGWSLSSQSPPLTDASRKRKSTDVPYQTEHDTAPWKKANNRNRFEDRITYPSTDKKARMALEDRDSSKSKANLEMRRKRFEGAGASFGNSGASFPIETRKPEGEQGPVVGRCQTLEKNYFRLTSAPNPESVRPLPVLRRALDLLKKKWKAESNYTYICDQFKSLRQDLTVQHIQNEFTVSVYENHARIALEKGDLGEYNQCQTQLRALYKKQLGGHPMEFKAYRILYFIYTRNWTAMNDTLADVTAEDKKDHAVKHALDVRSALALGNYHRFFLLYLDPPNMGAYLMDMFVDRERLNALSTICRAYKPDVPVRLITEELGFTHDDQAIDFIIEHSSKESLGEKMGL